MPVKYGRHGVLRVEVAECHAVLLVQAPALHMRPSDLHLAAAQTRVVDLPHRLREVQPHVARETGAQRVWGVVVTVQKAVRVSTVGKVQALFVCKTRTQQRAWPPRLAEDGCQ